jgi:hypothetical protein
VAFWHRFGGQLMEPSGSNPSEELKSEAGTAVLGGLGKAELKFAASYTAPFFWDTRNTDGSNRLRSGSAFFLNTGDSTFAVTAAHVVIECLQDTKQSPFIQCMLGTTSGRAAVPFALGKRLIDHHKDIDIATFWLTSEEISRTGCTVLHGYDSSWPPPLPQVGGGVTMCGFPGNARRVLRPKEMSFGIFGVAGVVANSNETAISVQIEREKLVRVLGDGAMPQNYDYRGISGGPVIAIGQTPTTPRMLAGVIYLGPNQSGVEGESIIGFEIIRARPAHFIKADGSIDVNRWEQSRPW